MPARGRRTRAAVGKIGPGSRLGRYRIGARLHEGGMAQLYEIAAPRRPLLLKVPKLGPGHPLSSMVAFENEVHVLQRLRGPHVPRFEAAGDLRTRPYLVMERIPGDELAQAAKRAPLAVEEIRDLGVRLCRAVQALHHQNVIHLDLNPSNVRNRADGTMVLIDFGMAHHTALPDLHDASFGEEEGTTPYISPEQVKHIRNDSRSDIYAIGAILYQLATGQYPFGRPNLLSLRKRLVQPPPPPRAHRPDLPPWLQEIILRCLETEPDQRYATAKRVAYLLAHPEVVHTGPRAHHTRSGGLGKRIGWWWQSLYRVFDDGRSSRPYERLTTSPHVLVALDPDHCSDALKEALRRAVRRLSRSERRAYFTCLSVLPKKELETAAAIKRIAPDVSRHVALRNWAQPLHLAQQRIAFQVLPGDPARTIIDYARLHQVDMVVIGARGNSALRRHIGSVSAAVTARAPCSVIVVRTRQDRKEQS